MASNKVLELSLTGLDQHLQLNGNLLIPYQILHFFKRSQSHFLFVLVHVDDIIITGSSPQMIQQVISNLQSTFALKDFGELN